MGDYPPPTEEMLFAITELADFSAITELPAMEDVSEDLAHCILEEAGKFFGNALAPLNRVGDEKGVCLDETSVRTPPGFREVYKQLITDGWISLSFPTAEGGQGLPNLLAVAIAEMMQSANLSFSMCPLLAPGVAEPIRALASEEVKNLYLPKIASGEWSTAMSLTESQSGSDLSMLRTKATPEEGHYRITGQKIFISWADHDMAENIVHLVLARIPGAPAGTKGISLFLVPKYLPMADGSLGPRNDFSVVSLEHKLGLHASPTCTVNYGERDGAIGYLIGQENQGLAAMFLLMNDARLQVGLQGVGLVARAYQQALAYAQERVQGRVKNRSEQVTIIQHADVRRMLMTMKAGLEAMRALAYVTAADIDVMAHGDKRECEARVGILTPIIKGWGTEFTQELVQLAVQVHGGMGYVEETGVAQYVRDAKVLTIYEGTSAIQAMDLVNRKLIKDGGQAFGKLIAEMQSLLKETHSADCAIQKVLDAFQHALCCLEEASQWVLENHDKEGTVLGGIAFDFMMLAGVVTGGWQMARAAVIADARVAEGEGNSDFYQQKIATSLFYAEHILPRADAYARVVFNGGSSVTAMKFESC